METGAHLGISQFLLVQWLAPIASESPEFIIAITWTLRGNAQSAIKALISSKVNQWTLLVGTIPLVYAISGGAIKTFQLDTLQDHELYLTAAQSIFAVAVLVNLKLSKGDGILLVALFAAQLIVEQIRMEVAAVYVALAIILSHSAPQVSLADRGHRIGIEAKGEVGAHARARRGGIG